MLRALCADLGRELAGRVNDGGGAEPLGFVLILCELPVSAGGQAVASNMPDVAAVRAIIAAADRGGG